MGRTGPDAVVAWQCLGGETSLTAPPSLMVDHNIPGIWSPVSHSQHVHTSCHVLTLSGVNRSQIVAHNRRSHFGLLLRRPSVKDSCKRQHEAG